MKKPPYWPSLLISKLANDTDITTLYGQMFRTKPLKFLLGVGQTVDMRFQCNIDTKLINRLLLLSSGRINYEVYIASAATANPKTVVPMYNLNAIANVPAVNVFEVGDIDSPLFTGGTLIDEVELATGSGSNAFTLPETQFGGRLLAAATTFYLRLSGLENNSKIQFFLFGQEGRQIGDNLEI